MKSLGQGQSAESTCTRNLVYIISDLIECDMEKFSFALIVQLDIFMEVCVRLSLVNLGKQVTEKNVDNGNRNQLSWVINLQLSDIAPSVIRS